MSICRDEIEYMNSSWHPYSDKAMLKKFLFISWSELASQKNYTIRAGQRASGELLNRAKAKKDFVGQKQYHKPDVSIWSPWRSKTVSEVSDTSDLASLTVSQSQMYPDLAVSRIHVRVRVKHMPPACQHDFQGKYN